MIRSSTNRNAFSRRLEACRREDIQVDAVVLEDWCDARLWELAENLHRADLTTIERAEHIAEWIRLRAPVQTEEDKIGQVAQFSENAKVGAGRGNEGGLRAAVRDLGIEHREARRSVAIDAIIPEAKEAARVSSIAEIKSALLSVAKEPPEKQVAKVAELAAKKSAPKLEPEVSQAAATEAAEIICDNVP
jgi:hypothetical protein